MTSTLPRRPLRYAASVSPARPWTHLSGEKGFEHDYSDDRGNNGVVRVLPRNGGDMLHVDWIGPRGVSPGEVSHTSGTGNVRGVFDQLFAHYPGAKFVSGTRTGGAFSGKPTRIVRGIPGRLEGRPVKYAKVDGDVKPHPLIAGFPISEFLKHLANDPANSFNVRELAKVAFTGGEGGEKGEGRPDALWALADAMDEESHPKRDHYNLRSAADKILLDKHVGKAINDVAAETARNNPWAHPWQVSPGSHANRASAAIKPDKGYDRTLLRADRHVLDKIRLRTNELIPGTPDNLIEESIRRHAVRATHLNTQVGNDPATAPSREKFRAEYHDRATNPLQPPETTSPGHHEELKATRYRRPRPRRYGRRDLMAWLDTNGGFHGVKTHGTHEAWADANGTTKADLQAAGWMRVTPGGSTLWAANPHRGPNDHQKSALVDAAMEHGFDTLSHDNDRAERVLWSKTERLSRGRPRRYALNARGDFIDSLRRVRSRQQQALKQAAQQVSQRLGLHPVHLVDALQDGPQGATPGVAQAVYGNASPEAVQGAAAYLAMINNATGFGVFHVRPTGPDYLHKFRVGGSGLDLRHRLDRAGIADRVLVPHRSGYDVLVPDPAGRLARNVRQFARQAGADLQTSRGHFRVVGDADQDRAREMFRGTLERMRRAKRRA